MRHAIISQNIRMRHERPDQFVVGDYSIIDDFCYFSTQICIGRGCHVANNVSIAGGLDRRFTMGNYASVSAGTRIWCASDDFVSDLVALPLPGMTDPKDNTIRGDVTMGNYTAVGCNSVVMPGVEIPEGTVIGAMSFVPPFTKLEPWSVYAGGADVAHGVGGSPMGFRRLGARDRDAVMRQVAAFEQRYQELLVKHHYS